MKLPKEAKRGIQEKIRAKMTGYSMTAIFYLETVRSLNSYHRVTLKKKSFFVKHHSHTVTWLYMFVRGFNVIKLPAKTDLSHMISSFLNSWK